MVRYKFDDYKNEFEIREIIRKSTENYILDNKYTKLQIFFINCLIKNNHKYFFNMIKNFSKNKIHKMISVNYYLFILIFISMDEKIEKYIIENFNIFKKLKKVHWIPIYNPFTNKYGNYLFHIPSDNLSFWNHQEIIVIPKTGSRTLCNLMSSYNFWHLPAKEYPSSIHKRLKCMVRNPYTRLLSGYFFLQRGGFNNVINPDHYNFKKEYDNTANGFKKFVKEWITEEKINPLKITTRSFEMFFCQNIYLCDNDGNLILEKKNIGRFENFKEETIRLFNRYSNIIYNSSDNYDKNNNFKFYDKKTQDIIYNLYKKDFELFNYPYELPIYIEPQIY